MAEIEESAKPGPGHRKSKRERVVGAAAKLFLGDGYGTTGMDAIASEAGVSKATVYSYYQDKATLFADVMSRMCEQLGGGHALKELASDSPEATLTAAAVFYLQRLLESLDRGILQRVVAEGKEFPELGKRFWAEGPAKMEQFVAGYLADAHRQGLLRVKDPTRAAQRFIGVVAGVYLLPRLVAVRNRPSERELRRELDEVIAGFLSTLREKPAVEK
jgi:TetR/AcrR family transcriptional regulator, mexJK operon transcriptional repressor